MRKLKRALLNPAAAHRLKQAMLNPAEVYKFPKDVLADQDLSRREKIKILKQWKYDALELQVASEENMPGEVPTMLNRVLLALAELGASTDPERRPPTKHGGGVE